MPPTYSISSESTGSTSSGTSGSSSSTVWGPGALTGKALLAFGNAALRAVESAVIYRKLRVIASDLSHSKDEVTSRSERFYDDLLELCRRDLYSSSVRLQALSLVMVQIATMRTTNLVKALVKWPSIEISLFISEILKCVPLDRSEASNEFRQVMYIKLEKLYISSQPQGTIHKADPFMTFIGQLATNGETGCEAIAESGLIDKLLTLFIDDSRSTQISHRSLGSNHSAQLLGISTLGCVDLHENVTVARDSSDLEACHLLTNFRKSRVGRGDHLTIVPFITRTGVTLLTQSGASNNIQVTINGITVSSSCCQRSEPNTSLHCVDYATNSTCADGGHPCRSMHGASNTTSFASHEDPSQGTGTILRRLKRAFSVGDKRRDEQLSATPTSPASFRFPDIATSSSSADADITHVHTNRSSRPLTNGHQASLSTPRRERIMRERLRRTISDSHLRRNHSVHDRGRLSKRDHSPQLEHGSCRPKRSYSVGDAQLRGRLVSKSKRFPITHSPSWAASTSSTIDRVYKDYTSSSDDFEFPSHSSTLSGVGLERKTVVVLPPLSSCSLKTDAVAIPLASKDSGSTQDQLCHSSESKIQASPTRLSRLGTIQRTRNKMRHIRRALSLNDKPLSKWTNEVPSPSRHVGDEGGTQASRDFCYHTSHNANVDVAMANSQGRSSQSLSNASNTQSYLYRSPESEVPASPGLSRLRTIQRTRSKLRHLKRAFSLSDKPRGADAGNTSKPVPHPSARDAASTQATWNLPRHTRRDQDEAMENSQGQPSSAPDDYSHSQHCPCNSPDSKDRASSSELFRSGTLQRTRNKLRRLKRAFSLNDKPPSQGAGGITSSCLVTAQDIAAEHLSEADGARSPRDPWSRSPREDEPLESSPDQYSRARTSSDGDLNPLKRILSMGDRQQERLSTMQRLRRAFSSGDRTSHVTRVRSHPKRLEESFSLIDSLGTPTLDENLSTSSPHPDSHSRPLPAYTADEPSSDIRDEEPDITSLPLVEPSTNLPSYELQSIADFTPTTGEDEVPPPYLDFSEQQADNGFLPVNSVYSKDFKFTLPPTSHRPSFAPPDLHHIQPCLPPLQGDPSAEDAHVASYYTTQTATSIHPSSCNPHPTVVIYLQHRGSIKKARIHDTISFSLLREAFLERFPVNLSLESFPQIYIQDPDSGVKYELEDINDVRENSLISLDTNPLDEIKLYIDSRLSDISQDIRYLQSVITTDYSMSTFMAPSPLARGPSISRSSRLGSLGTWIDGATITSNQLPQVTTLTDQQSTCTRSSTRSRNLQSRPLPKVPPLPQS